MRKIVLIALVILIPALAHAVALVNINAANATLLDTLPGIGPSKAADIVTYRNGHGPFARIEDIQNVSGIGPSTYAGIAPFITVGDSGVSNSNSNQIASSTSSDSTSTPPTATISSSGSTPEYIPVPTLRIVTNDDRTVSSGADIAFTATVYDGKGNKRDDAMVTWSFGDGMRKTGASVFHEYYDPGEYLVIVHATTSDGGNAQEEIVVTVKDASIKISSVSSRGIMLANGDSRTLDLSLWRLSMSGKEFKIPEDTQILAGHTILFPSQVIELPLADSAFLLYPSGEVAAQFPPQPSSSMASYQQVQAVEPPVISKAEPIISTKANIQTHDEAVGAPTAANELAAVGAATSSSSRGVFKSPWTLSFLGIVALAGGAFILL